jgi:hypothetical protein
VEVLPERGAHAVGAPGVGLDHVAVPEVGVRGRGWVCGGIAASESVAEKVSVDVGDVGGMLGGHGREFGVERGEEVDDCGPGWQADAPGVASAVTGVVDRAHDDRGVRAAHQRSEPAQCLSDPPAHDRDDPSCEWGIAINGEQVIAADGESRDGVGFQNPVPRRDLGFQAAGSYWLIRSPRIGRRRTRP